MGSHSTAKAKTPWKGTVKTYEICWLFGNSPATRICSFSEKHNIPWGRLAAYEAVWRNKVKDWWHPLFFEKKLASLKQKNSVSMYAVVFLDQRRQYIVRKVHPIVVKQKSNWTLRRKMMFVSSWNQNTVRKRHSRVYYLLNLERGWARPG